MRSATAYIRSRHDQKSSLAASRRSVSAGEGALEGVAVRVDDAGQQRPGENARACGRERDVGRHLGPAAVGAGAQQHVLAPAVGQPGERRPERRRAAIASAAIGAPVERRLQQRAQHRLQAARGGRGRPARPAARRASRPCTSPGPSRAGSRARARLRPAVAARDVAALEAAVGDVAERSICAASTAISASRSAGAQLAPPAVPRLRSGSRPSNSHGTSAWMLCPSHSIAWPCAATRRASSAASASWYGRQYAVDAALDLALVGNAAVAIERVAAEEARRHELGVVRAGVHRRVLGRPVEIDRRSATSAARARSRRARARSRRPRRGASRCPRARARAARARARRRRRSRCRRAAG